MYSAKAIPQLIRMADHSAIDLCLRCPYQAIVMKVFETVSSRANFIASDIGRSGPCRRSPACYQIHLRDGPGEAGLRHVAGGAGVALGIGQGGIVEHGLAELLQG